MDFRANFRRLGSFDPSRLRALVAELPDEAWEGRDYEPLRDHAKTVFLIPDDGRFNPRTPAPDPRWKDYEAVVAPLLDQIAGFFGERGYVHRVALTTLAGRGSVQPHAVLGGRLRYVHRIHAPLVTSGDVTFTVGGETAHLPVGEIWEINNTREHQVDNAGPDARIHAVIDWVTPDGVRGWRLHLLGWRFRKLGRRSRRQLRRLGAQANRAGWRTAWKLRAALRGDPSGSA